MKKPENGKRAHREKFLNASACVFTGLAICVGWFTMSKGDPSNPNIGSDTKFHQNTSVSLSSGGDRQRSQPKLQNVRLNKSEQDLKSFGDFLSEGREILNFPHGSVRRDKIHGLVERWAKHDFTQALNWAMDLEGVADRREAIVAALMGGDDAAEMATKIQEFGVKLSRLESSTLGYSYVGRLTTSLVESIGPEDALDWISLNLSGALRAGEENRVLRILAENEPQKAIAYWRSIPSGDKSDKAFLRIMESWIDADTSKALDFLIERPLTNLNKEALTVAGKTLVRGDYDAYLDILNTIDDQNVLNELAIGGMGGLHGMGANEMFAISKHLDGSIRNNKEKEFLDRWALRHPSEATAFIKHNPGFLKKTNEFEINIVRGFANSGEFREAASWVNDNEDSKLRVKLTEELMGEWIGVGYQEASEWIVDIDDGPQKDAGVLVMVKSSVEIYPDVARQWAGLLTTDDAKNAASEILKDPAK